MKNAILTILSVLAFTPAFAGAQVSDGLFEVKTDSIVDYVNYDITQFLISVDVNESGSSNIIAYWKVRLYCEDDVVLGLNSHTENNCNQAVTIQKSDLKNFSLFMQTGDDELKKISYKLKAYDDEGKWLHTEGQSFHWK